MRIGDPCPFRQTKPLYTHRAILPNKIEGYSPNVRMLQVELTVAHMAALHGRHVQASLLSPPQIVEVQRAGLNVMADLSDLDASRTVP